MVDILTSGFAPSGLGVFLCQALLLKKKRLKVVDRSVCDDIFGTCQLVMLGDMHVSSGRSFRNCLVRSGHLFLAARCSCSQHSHPRLISDYLHSNL